MEALCVEGAEKMESRKEVTGKHGFRASATMAPCIFRIKEVR